MNFKSTLISSSLIALSLTSCSVYYTTSEVDSSLKSTVDRVNSTIQLCDVGQYTTQFEKVISDFTVNQKQLGDQLIQYQKQVADLISTYSKTKPELCKELIADLQKINTDVTQISRIKMNLQLAVTAFKTGTQGKTKIYSCNKDWKVVTDAETAVKTQQKETNALQQSIQTTATHLQGIAQALEQ